MTAKQGDHLSKLKTHMKKILIELSKKPKCQTGSEIVSIKYQKTKTKMIKMDNTDI